MRVYIAGYYSAHGLRTLNGQIVSMAKPEFCLESYFYIGRPGEIEKVRKDKDRKLFLDSGAFSMFTQGIEISFEKYAQFIKDNQDIIEVASNLDAIGVGREQENYANHMKLKELGAPIQPVHHARDQSDWLQRYLDEGYDYIFLGGMVPENTVYLRNWLDHVWEKYLCNPDGTARVKVHGFGLTVHELMLRYPWYSVDSTSWVLASRYGKIFMDFADGRFIPVDFSSQSSMQYKDNSTHYLNLRPSEKKVVEARLEEIEAEREKDLETESWLEEKTGIKQGYNPEALAHFYGWRDHWNINHFRRMQSRSPTHFLREQPGLFA